MDVVDLAKYLYKKMEEREKISQPLLAHGSVKDWEHLQNDLWERYGVSLLRKEEIKPCWRKT